MKSESDVRRAARKLAEAMVRGQVPHSSVMALVAASEHSKKRSQ